MQEGKVLDSVITTKKSIIAAGCQSSGWQLVLPILDDSGILSEDNNFSHGKEDYVFSDSLTQPFIDISILPTTGHGIDEKHNVTVNSLPALLEDSRSLDNPLDFYLEQLPDTVFLLFFVRAETAIINGLHKGYEPEKFLQIWVSAHQHILKFLRRHRKRTLLFNSEAAAGNPQSFINILEKNKVISRPTKKISPVSINLPPDELSLARYMVYEDTEVQSLHAELVASAQPLAEPDFSWNTLKIKNQIILRLHNARYLQEEKIKIKKQLEQSQEKLQLFNKEKATLRQHAKEREEKLEKSNREISEENELLLLQLHQVQEELEEIFLQKQQLEQTQHKKEKSEGEKEEAGITSAPSKMFKSRSHDQSKSPLKSVAKFFQAMSKKQRLLHSQINKLRSSGYFDEEWYLTQYPDVAEAGMEPIKHYILYGATEGRNPSPSFNTIHYISTNSEAATSGINPLIHYLEHNKTH